MRGRKASEVNELLGCGEQTRSAPVDILERNFRHAADALRKSGRGKQSCLTGMPGLTGRQIRFGKLLKRKYGRAIPGTAMTNLRRQKRCRMTTTLWRRRLAR